MNHGFIYQEDGVYVRDENGDTSVRQINGDVKEILICENQIDILKDISLKLKDDAIWYHKELLEELKEDVSLSSLMCIGGVSLVSGILNFAPQQLSSTALPLEILEVVGGTIGVGAVLGSFVGFSTAIVAYKENLYKMKKSAVGSLAADKMRDEKIQYLEQLHDSEMVNSPEVGFADELYLNDEVHRCYQEISASGDGNLYNPTISVRRIRKKWDISGSEYNDYIHTITKNDSDKVLYKKKI